jgi:uncharacterized iron-regulated membrane protein
MGAFVAKAATGFAAWMATWGLADLQILVGILSGLAFAGYTIAQWRALARRERAAQAQDKRDEAEDRRHEAQDRRDAARDRAAQRDSERDGERNP